MAHTVEPPLEQILRYCAEDPVERVFLEDVARRGLGRFAGLEQDGRLVALCHTGANVVPSGRGLRRVRRRDRARQGADADRRAGRGQRPLGCSTAQAARAPRGPARASRSTRSRSRPRRGRAGCARRGSPTSTCSCPPARGRTRSSSGSIRSHGTRTASAGGRGRRSRRAAPGSGSRTVSSSSRPRRRPGRPRPCSCSRSGPTPSRAARGHGSRGLRDLIRLLLERVPRVCLFVRAENQTAIRLYDSVGMQHVLDYRSVLL